MRNIDVNSTTNPFVRASQQYMAGIRQSPTVTKQDIKAIELEKQFLNDNR